MPTTRPYARPRTIRLLAGLVLLVGLGSAVVAVAYELNGATKVGGEVTVPVQLVPADGNVLPTAGGVRLPGPALPAGAVVEAGRDALTLRADGATLAEQLVSRGGLLALGISLGLGGVLMRRLLLSVAAGRPFEDANPRRLAVIAVLVVTGGLLSGILPDVAAVLVEHRLGLVDADSPVVVHVDMPLLPILLALLVLALAEAFRRGAELTRDLDGLV